MTQALKNTAAVILAAGKGTRMQAKHKNKVAYTLNGKPMIAHTVDHLRQVGISQIVVVIGFQADSVKRALGSQVDYVKQKQQLGTGHALKTAIPAIRKHIQTVLSVYGDDSAFYPPELYQKLVRKQQATKADVLVLTIHKDDPAGLGRIVRDQAGQIKSIVEEKNATAKQKKIQEINTGFYCFNRQFLANHLDKLTLNPVSQEYYATDLVEIALLSGGKVETYYLEDSSVWHGVNTLADYQEALAKYRDQHHD